MIYRTAKELLNARDVYNYFPIEDTLGYFEETNGFDNLRWLEVKFFGDSTYRPINPGVELIESTSFEKNQEALNAFRDRLYMAVLNRELGAVPGKLAG